MIREGAKRDWGDNVDENEQLRERLYGTGVTGQLLVGARLGEGVVGGARDPDDEERHSGDRTQALNAS